MAVVAGRGEAVGGRAEACRGRCLWDGAAAVEEREEGGRLLANENGGTG